MIIINFVTFGGAVLLIAEGLFYFASFFGVNGYKLFTSTYSCLARTIHAMYFHFYRRDVALANDPDTEFSRTVKGYFSCEISFTEFYKFMLFGEEEEEEEA